MIAIIIQGIWQFFAGLALLMFDFWQLKNGKAYGKYGMVYTRDENPISFWFQVSLLFVISIFVIILAVCQ
jgi:hypothetical protein